MRLAAAVFSVLLLAGCTAKQWGNTQTKAEKAQKRAQGAAEVVKVLPLPPEIKAPAQGIFKGLAAIAGAVAAFAAWRKRVADAKAAKAEKGFDAVSEAVDNSGTLPADFTSTLKSMAEKHLGSAGALKTLHHESIVRRG